MSKSKAVKVDHLSDMPLDLPGATTSRPAGGSMSGWIKPLRAGTANVASTPWLSAWAEGWRLLMYRGY